ARRAARTPRRAHRARRRALVRAAPAPAREPDVGVLLPGPPGARALAGVTGVLPPRTALAGGVRLCGGDARQGIRTAAAGGALPGGVARGGPARGGGAASRVALRAGRPAVGDR